MQSNLFNIPKKILIGIVVVFMVLGIGIRLIDLKDAPFDFNPVRQFRGALISRYMYYQMLPDATEEELDKVEFFREQQEELEPLIIEGLMAVTYKLIGGESIWVVRIYNSVFWLIGGWFLFQLARKVGSDASALVALGFYIFLPFSIQASRSFQPDPMMTMWIILTVYAAYCWAEKQNWQWTLRLGLVGGMAILTKGNAAFYIGMMMIALVIHEFGLKEAIKNKKIWAIGLLMIAPILIHYVLVLGDQFTSYINRATVKNFDELFTVQFYFLWMNRVKDFLNIGIIFFALIGVIMAKGRIKTLLLGLWVGYGLLGLVFHYHIRTHDYYHILLPFLVGLSLVSVSDAIFEKVSKDKLVWQIVLIGVLILAMSYGVVRARYLFVTEDFQVEVDLWEKIGAELPDNGATISIMPHYGYQLMYYGWQKTTILFPEKFDTFDPQEYNYLLVLTLRLFDENQTFKQSIIENYPLLVDGGYYFIYDLQSPLGQ